MTAVQPVEERSYAERTNFAKAFAVLWCITTKLDRRRFSLVLKTRDCGSYTDNKHLVLLL